MAQSSTYWKDLMRRLEEAPVPVVDSLLPPTAPGPMPGLTVPRAERSTDVGLPPAPRRPGTDVAAMPKQPVVGPMQIAQALSSRELPAGPRAMDEAPLPPTTGLPGSGVGLRSPLGRLELEGGGIGWELQNPLVQEGTRGSVGLRSPLAEVPLEGPGRGWEFRSPFTRAPQSGVAPDDVMWEFSLGHARQQPGRPQAPISGPEDVAPDRSGLPMTIPPPPPLMPTGGPGTFPVPVQAPIAPRPRPGAAQGAEAPIAPVGEAALARSAPSSDYPVGAPIGPADADQAAVQAAVDDAVAEVRKGDRSRAGNVRGEPIAPVDEPDPTAPWDAPGRIGEMQRGLRSRLGLGNEQSQDLGVALMMGGAALMSGPGNFGKAIGEAVGAGVGAYATSRRDRREEQRLERKYDLDRRETEERIRIADEQLGMAREKFEFDKKQAALDRLDPLKKLREERDRLTYEREIATLEGGGSIWDEMARSGFSDNQIARLRVFGASGGEVLDPVTGMLTPEARDVALGGRSQEGLSDLGF